MVDGWGEGPSTNQPITGWIDSHTTNPVAGAFYSLKTTQITPGIY